MVAFATDVWDVALAVKCLTCKADYVIFMMVDDYFDWKDNKKNISDALYYLSSNERELLISRTCGSCFDKMFPPLDSNE